MSLPELANLEDDALIRRELRKLFRKKRNEYAYMDSESIELLEAIVTMGRKEVGANHAPQLTFFSTSDDVSAGNHLDMRILTSLLSDCNKTSKRPCTAPA